MGLILALTVVYLGVFALLVPTMGAMAGALAVLPVAAAGLAFGARGGLLVAAGVSLGSSLLRLLLERDVELANARTLIGVLSLVVVAAGVGYARDLSVRLAEREKQANRTRAELTALIDAIPDTLVRVDASMVVTGAWRPELMRGACLKPPQVGCEIRECGGPEVLSALQPLLAQVTPGVTPATEIEFDDAGVKKRVEARISVTATGERLLVFRDITAAHELRERLLAAERGRALAEAQARIDQAQRLASLGTMAAGIAHEINNPLSYLIGMLELLERKVASGQVDGPRTAEVLSSVHNSALRIATIVRDMQTLSRSGTTDPATPVDVARAVGAATNLASMVVKHRAQLSVDVTGAPAVMGFEGRLGQVLVNLIVNAAQAMPKRPTEQNHIKVTARSVDDGRSVRLDVEDNGSGMPEEVMARVFDPFFTTKGPGEGSGLGLAISRALVEKMGGSLTVRSSLGAGSTFSVVLPAVSSRRLDRERAVA